ncbi:MAG: hypothetical protein ACOVOY_11905, partial [Sediminibacterium sp.]
MQKKFLLLSLLVIVSSVNLTAQLLSTNIPFPRDTDNLSITVDASKGNRGLNNYTPVSDVYVHTGVITNLSASNTDWKYVKLGNQNPWGKLIPELQAVSLGNNLWRYDINNIRAFYGVPAGETILKIAILFRSGNGSLKQANIDGSDMYLNVYSSSVFAQRFINPALQPTFTPIVEPINKTIGESVPVLVQSNTAANFTLYFNGTVIQTATAAQTVAATPVVAQPGNQEIVSHAVNGGTTLRDTVRFFVAGSSNIAPLPAGVRDGINYGSDNT